MTTPTIVEDRGFVVQLDEFAGPLDLLLTLIRDQEVDIRDIPIAQIAEQFMAAIGVLGLNEAADYLEMAARLLRIKIQMLLPRPFDAEDWEDPRAELVRRLLEYEQVREVVEWLETRAQARADRYGRGWIQELPEQPPHPISLELERLVRAVEDVIADMPQPIVHRVVPRPLDVEGATRRITELLAAREHVELRELFGETPTIADVISVIVALLELARMGHLWLAQREPFGTVGITRESPDQAS